MDSLTGRMSGDVTVTCRSDGGGFGLGRGPVAEVTEVVLSVFEKWVRHTIDDSSLGADGVRTADVNGDGLPDLVEGWGQGGVSRVYSMEREAGRRPDWRMIEVGAAPAVAVARLVDLDWNGAIEVMSCTEGNSRKVLVHWASGKAGDYGNSAAWKTETLWEDGNRGMFAVAIDVDGRHGPDLISGGKGRRGAQWHRVAKAYIRIGYGEMGHARSERRGRNQVRFESAPRRRRRPICDQYGGEP